VILGLRRRVSPRAVSSGERVIGDLDAIRLDVSDNQGERGLLRVDPSSRTARRPQDGSSCAIGWCADSRPGGCPADAGRGRVLDRGPEPRGLGPSWASDQRRPGVRRPGRRCPTLASSNAAATDRPGHRTSAGPGAPATEPRCPILASSNPRPLGGPGRGISADRPEVCVTAVAVDNARPRTAADSARGALLDLPIDGRRMPHGLSFKSWSRLSAMSSSWRATACE
jgi:hypothetical protein